MTDIGGGDTVFPEGVWGLEEPSTSPLGPLCLSRRRVLEEQSAPPPTPPVGERAPGAGVAPTDEATQPPTVEEEPLPERLTQLLLFH
jgi:hypothetical protein